MKAKVFLLAIAILTFTLYDTATTIIVANYLGSWGYETSAVIRQAQDVFGVMGFMIIKIIFCIMCLLMVYLITGMQKQTEVLANSLFCGLAMTGLYAGTSNLNIILNGTSFFFMGLNAQEVCLLILWFSILVGVLLTASKWVLRVSSPGYKLKA